MSAVVWPAASADFTSTQVIFSNSTRSACARGAARADPAASTREVVPQAINISMEFQTEPMRMSFSFPQKHEFLSTLMRDRKFHHFIILTNIVPFAHDSAIRRENALGDPLARRFTRPRRVRPGRVHRRCSRSSIPDALCDYPASAKAGGCIGCRVARPLGKAAASELAWLQGTRTSARSAAADRGAEISYIERRRTSRPLAHRARACPGRGDAYRTYSGAD